MSPATTSKNRHSSSIVASVIEIEPPVKRTGYTSNNNSIRIRMKLCQLREIEIVLIKIWVKLLVTAQWE